MFPVTIVWYKEFVTSNKLANYHLVCVNTATVANNPWPKYIREIQRCLNSLDRLNDELNMVRIICWYRMQGNVYKLAKSNSNFYNIYSKT